MASSAGFDIQDRAPPTYVLRALERVGSISPVGPYYTVDKGLAGGAPGVPPTYVGMCHIFCDSVESFQAGFGPHAKEIMADIPNYTDLTPVLQISEVVVERATTFR